MVSARAFVTAAALVLFSNVAAHSAAPVKPSGKLEIPDRAVWAGEIFDFGLSWRVEWDSFSYLEGPPVWNSGPIVIQPWQGPTYSSLPPAAGRQMGSIRYRTRGLATEPGMISLQPARQLMVVQTGVIRMTDYERAVTGTVSVPTEGASIQVRPLPQPPKKFSGAIGRFALAAAVEPKQAEVGTPFTWTLALSGVGNWPRLKGMPPREISREFKSIGAPRLTEMPGATIFERTIREEVNLVPQSPGRHVLGPVEMTVFDTLRGEYVTISTDPIVLDVRPAGSSSADSTAGSAGAGAAAPAAEPLPPLLSSTGLSTPPMTDTAWRIATAWPVLALVALWLMLALLRARQQDPEREARRSHARLGNILRQLEGEPGTADQRRLVRAWQRDVGLRWKLDHSSPVPASFSGHDDWARLWAEAEVFLYGRAASLPSDWTARARRLWAEQGQPPRFEPATMFRRTNLYPLRAFPFRAVICLFAIMLSDPLHAAPAIQSETHWRERIASNPTDWKARHNLAVSLAVRKRWEEAASHAAIAWVQQPRAQATGDTWTRFAREAGYAGGAANSIPQPLGWWGRFISLGSPILWQALVAVLVPLAAFGAALVLLFIYGHCGRKIGLGGFIVFLAAAAGAGISGISLHSYGAMAKRDAVVVWRSTPLRNLPVEAPVKSSPQMVGAGTAAYVDGYFLGWLRLRLPEGPRGWVREENAIWVWRNPSAWADR